jgi:predicted AlkP superfamily pyrophosphatase or phosphodiesterase
MQGSLRSRRARGRLIGAVLCIPALLAPAAAATTGASERPLVYVVVLDGLERDRVEQGKAPFISSLLAGEGANATYFPNSRSVMPAETNPNHIAMMSGAFPGRSGNPSNAFALYAPLEHEDSCATTGPFDFSSPPTETSGESSTCPQAEMLFESIRHQGNPDQLALAGVFGKPKLGRIFSGSNFRRSRRDVDYLWAPCASGPEDDEYCESVPTDPIRGYALDDETVMDRVIAASVGGIQVPDGRRRPDFTFVNLHQIDSAGHVFGTGPVYDTAIARADDQVERLVTVLRAHGEWERTVMILVSDHGMDQVSRKVSLTDELTANGIAESEFVALNDSSNIDYIYLADRRSPERFALLKRMREIVLATPGVDEVFYREPNPLDGGREHTMPAVHADWKASGPRSGDLFVVGKPGVGFGEPAPTNNPLPGNHGGPQTRDNFLAVVSGGPLVRQGTSSDSPQNVDVAPSVMGLFGLAAPADSRGEFLADAFERGELRRVSRPHRPRVRLRSDRVSIKPRHSRYDIQLRRGKQWRFLARNRRKATLNLPRRAGEDPRVRARLRSAAGITGPWRVAR